jgi:hypothetical protein
MSDERVCYCGAGIRPHGEGWRHVGTNSKWCYESERGMDPDSRCDAMPDPDLAPVEGEWKP